LFSKKESKLSPRKAGNLSNGRLVIFIREILYNFIKVLKQTVEAMKLHQRSHLIYSVDETELQMTYSSGNQKLLAVKGSKRIHSATHGEKIETVRVMV
jgi:hypothetical protein